MSNLPATDQAEAPPPKRRLAPKNCLRAMTIYLSDMVVRARGAGDGEPTHTIVCLTPEDLEALTDIAATLDYFFIERQKAAVEAERKKNWGRQ